MGTSIVDIEAVCKVLQVEYEKPVTIFTITGVKEHQNEETICEHII